MLDGPGNRRLGVAEFLFGRSSDLGAITAFVEQAGIGGQALLLLGEPVSVRRRFWTRRPAWRRKLAGWCCVPPERSSRRTCPFPG